MVASGPICSVREHMAMPAPSGVPSQTSLLGSAHSGLHRSDEIPPRYAHLPVKSWTATLWVVDSGTATADSVSSHGGGEVDLNTRIG
jgi:hypothetical protein